MDAVMITLKTVERNHGGMGEKLDGTSTFTFEINSRLIGRFELDVTLPNQANLQASLDAAMAGLGDFAGGLGDAAQRPPG